MNEINFKGGFLLKKPSGYKNIRKFNELWDGIQKAMPNKKCVFQEFNENGDKFFAIQTIYDRAMVNILLSKKAEFKFYPDINLKNRLNIYFTEEAQKTINAQTNVIEKKEELLNFVKTAKNTPAVIPQYKWKPNDHIEKTFKVIGAEPSEHKVSIKKGITYIRDKKGKLVAIASPNNRKGVNYVYIYPKRSEETVMRYAVAQNGDKVAIGPLQSSHFKDLFIENVKIDLGRIRPKSVSE